MLRLLLPLLLVSVLGETAVAAQLTYEAHIRPILKKHCFQCHGEGGTVEANLDLRLRRFVVRGGDSGPAIVPGNANGSLLIQRVSSGEMPPSNDQRLSAAEVDVLRRWVDASAPTSHPEPDSLGGNTYFTNEEKNWWAFRPVLKPQPPTTQTTIATPIDAFILAKLAEFGAEHRADRNSFVLAPTAERTTLIRRAYLDLLGVPPHSAAVRRFVDDSNADAWSRVVDSVLASPRYGERWGRHWLDVAGYADSEGYTEEDRVRKHAWRYRDYVIQALNQDKPYSDFVTEQLAGDELVGWPAAAMQAEYVDSLTATGFLRMAPDGTASSGVDQDLARNQVLADTMQIVGAALLGMTIQCAQCHDHRYDPIPQRDYYQLRAIFEPALDWKNWRTPANRLVSLYSEDDKRRRQAIEAQAKQVDDQRQERVDFYIEATLDQELLMVADALRKPLRLAFQAKPAARTDEHKKLLERYANIANITAGSLYLYDRRRDARANDLDHRRQVKIVAHLERIRGQAWATLDDSMRRDVLAAIDIPPNKRTKEQQRLVDRHAAVGVTAETLAEFDPKAAAEIQRYRTAAAQVRKFRIRTELQKYSDRAKALRDTIPKEHSLRILSEVPSSVPETFVFHRGDQQQPKDRVQPRGLSILAAPQLKPPAVLKTSGRRLQFARYLTDGRHPLVARVFVNRVWAHHFGRGLVSTTGDFGVLGARPTHSRLLDWLAADFVESGWSVKRLHRLILTSLVYQQSTLAADALVHADLDNRLLGRWPLRRLESETLRDVILSAAGQLNSKMYGEPVPVMEDEVGQIVLGKENLDGERKPTKPIPLLGEEYRRSMYIQVRRTRPLSVLESFDLPDLAPHCTERATSNVAPQSLMLMNSDLIVTMSGKMADRLISNRLDQPTNQLRRGWELTYGRPPNKSEATAANAFLGKQTKTFAKSGQNEADAHRSALATYCQALLGSNQLLYIE